MNDIGSSIPSIPSSYPPIHHSERTEVLYGNDNIIKKTLETFSRIREKLQGSIDNAGPAIHVIYEPIWDGLVRLKEKGVKIRVVTEITSDNISYCKKLMEVCELRHLDGIRTNFAIADGKEALLHGVSQDTNPLSQAILTTARGLVEAQEYLFDNLWKNAIPAQYKIKELEEGVKPPFIETLSDPVEIQKVSLELVNSAKQEIQMLLHANGNSSRSNRSLGAEFEQLIIQLFNVAMQDGIRARILTYKDMQKQIEGLTKGQQKQGKLEIRLIDKLQQQQQRLQTKVSFLIVDSKVCLVNDLKVYDENNNNSSDQLMLPLATYSNSESTVLTYISIFETLWTQTELRSLTT